MARFFVPLDVNYQFDDKILRAGPLAECLYVRSLALVKRTATEGRLHHSHLSSLALGLPGAASKHASALVAVGLWEQTEDGWYIAGWLKHNLSNEALTEQKARIRAKSVLGNHKRHHVDKGVVEPDCELCNPPHGEKQSSLQGAKMFPTEDEPKTKTNKNRRRTEDEQENESSSSSLGLKLVANPPDDDDRIHEAIEYHVDAVSDGHTSGYGITVRANDLAERGDMLRAYLHCYPDATAEELAVRVLGINTGDLWRIKRWTGDLPERNTA